MTSAADTLVADYLEQLQRELSDIPRARRRELMDEIAGHVAEARRELEPDDEVGIRNLLDRLGDPAEIAAEERARSGLVTRRAGGREIVALVGLLVGGFLFVIGWFVGVVLLWVSDSWTTREKLVGTLVVPGGLLPAFLLLSGAVGGYSETCSSEIDPATGDVLSTVCSGGPSTGAQVVWIAILIGCLVGPFFTTAFLARRMNRAETGYQPSPGSA